MVTNKNNNGHHGDDQYAQRRKEAEAFGKSKLGVKGLVDSGISQIPTIFHHPQDSLFCYEQQQSVGLNVEIPVIDMSSTSLSHEELVDSIRNAATKFGFFQVINHGVPVSFLDRMLGAIKAVHELPAEEKVSLYRSDILETGTGFGFSSYHDLFESMPASWCDSVSARLAPNPVDPLDIPAVCRTEIKEWDKEVTKLGEQLVAYLSEGLGLSADRLKGVSYLERKGMVGHYYPHCPEPNKTIGTATHTDLGMLTVLLQDQVGGLQVEHDGHWLDLKPIQGALVINIGDLFQILSNDNYKSGEHRVYANPWKTPRVSIATFLSPKFDDESLYGPLDELISPANPPLYKQLKFSELLKRFMARELDSKSMVDYFRL